MEGPDIKRATHSEQKHDTPLEDPDIKNTVEQKHYNYSKTLSVDDDDDDFDTKARTSLA